MTGTSPRDSSARARELGSELQRVRRRAKIKSTEIAARMECSESKVSRMESGTRGVSELDVATYLVICGAGMREMNVILDLVRQNDDGYWLRPYNQQLPMELRSLIIQESSATELNTFQPIIVPGLLQTEEYARSLFLWAGLVPQDAMDVRVKARRSRQQLLRRPSPPYLTCFIHEHALRAVVGDAAVMNEQLLHLVFLTSRPQYDIRVIPASAGPVGIFGGSFTLMRYHDHPPVAYAETQAAGVFFEQPDDIALYRTILGKLAELALDREESRAWLARLASEYDRAEGGRA